MKTKIDNPEEKTALTAWLKAARSLCLDERRIRSFINYTLKTASVLKLPDVLGFQAAVDVAKNASDIVGARKSPQWRNKLMEVSLLYNNGNGSKFISALNAYSAQILDRCVNYGLIQDRDMASQTRFKIDQAIHDYSGRLKLIKHSSA